MKLFQIKENLMSNFVLLYVVFGLSTHSNSHQNLPIPLPTQVMILGLECDISKNWFTKDAVLESGITMNY